MNQCPYCGKKYPAEVMVCPVDGEPLGRPVAARKKVTGVWRGCYGYGPRRDRSGLRPVAFTLKLKQGWTSHFTGSVTEDAPAGMPGTGTVDGYFSHPSFEFTKLMPVGYVMTEDGGRQTVREYLADLGMAVSQEPPGLPILYQGRFLDANRVQGTWIIQPQPIRLADGKSVGTPGGAGYWCAEFASENLDANPGSGPTTELFDKACLSDREVAAVEPSPPCFLGKFPAAEAEQWMAQLTEAGIWATYGVHEADQAGGAAVDGPMSIYVRAEDEAAARNVLANRENDMGEPG